MDKDLSLTAFRSNLDVVIAGVKGTSIYLRAKHVSIESNMHQAKVCMQDLKLHGGKVTTHNHALHTSIFLGTL